MANKICREQNQQKIDERNKNKQIQDKKMKV